MSTDTNPPATENTEDDRLYTRDGNRAYDMTNPRDVAAFCDLTDTDGGPDVEDSEPLPYSYSYSFGYDRGAARGIALSAAITLLDGTEEYRAPGKGEPMELVARIDEEAAARVRLSGAYATIATAEAVESLNDSLSRQNDVLTELTQHAVGGLVLLSAAANRQAASLAEISRTAKASRCDTGDRAAAVIDAELHDSASRAGCWSVGALFLALWAAIGAPRPDWSWLPQDALPGWFAGAAALAGIALALGGAAVTVTRYAEARIRWSARS